MTAVRVAADGVRVLFGLLGVVVRCSEPQRESRRVLTCVSSRRPQFVSRSGGGTEGRWLRPGGGCPA